MFFNITSYGRRSYFPYVFEKDDPKLPTKRKASNHYQKDKSPVEFIYKVEEYCHHFFIKQLKQLPTVFAIDFKKKDFNETLQTMEILFLKALREEGFCHELQQMSSLFSSDLHKFRLGTQLKTLTHIVDEKEIKIKDTIIILSLSASKAVSI